MDSLIVPTDEELQTFVIYKALASSGSGFDEADLEKIKAATMEFVMKYVLVNRPQIRRPLN